MDIIILENRFTMISYLIILVTYFVGMQGAANFAILASKISGLEALNIEMAMKLEIAESVRKRDLQELQEVLQREIHVVGDEVKDLLVSQLKEVNKALGKLFYQDLNDVGSVYILSFLSVIHYIFSYFILSCICSPFIELHL
jgi:hypothetical protein